MCACKRSCARARVSFTLSLAIYCGLYMVEKPLEQRGMAFMTVNLDLKVRERCSLYTPKSVYRDILKLSAQDLYLSCNQERLFIVEMKRNKSSTTNSRGIGIKLQSGGDYQIPLTRFSHCKKEQKGELFSPFSSLKYEKPENLFFKINND